MLQAACAIIVRFAWFSLSVNIDIVYLGRLGWPLYPCPYWNSQRLTYQTKQTRRWVFLKAWRQILSISRQATSWSLSLSCMSFLFGILGTYSVSWTHFRFVLISSPLLDGCISVNPSCFVCDQKVLRWVEPLIGVWSSLCLNPFSDISTINQDMELPSCVLRSEDSSQVCLTLIFSLIVI